MKFILWIFTLIAISSFDFPAKTNLSGEVPTTAIKITCLRMDYIKELVVISSQEEYEEFISKSSAATIIGGNCLDYKPPVIDFNINYLFVIHSTSGGCEDPDIEKSFSYNQVTDKYEYLLTFKQKGICKALHHFFESVLVKRTDIDLSRVTFSSKTIMPPPEIR